MSGSQMHDADAQARSEAAAAMGRARTPAKSAAAKARGEKLAGKPISEEHKRKIAEKNAAHWEKKRQEKAQLEAEAIAAGTAPPKRVPGRPKKTDAETVAREG